MSSKLRVSVVMPSYNHARFIKEAIDSVLTQDYDNVDLLVMDGGSSDETIDILRSYGDKLNFVSQRDRGQSDAINRGLARVDGDIICWLNSDDLFTPHAIRKVARAFEEHPEVDFVYGKGWNIDESGAAAHDSGVLPLDRWKLIHQRNFIQQPSCFFRKSLFEAVGPVDELLYYVMDWELWIRFSAYKGLFVDQYLSCNRVYGSNKTQSGHFKRWREIRDMVRRYSDRRYPPVIGLYFLEALLQLWQARAWPGRLNWPIRRLFFWGMMKEMSGRYLDGGIAPTFQFSVGNPYHAPALRLNLTPLSRYDTARCGQPPVTIAWKSSGGQRGTFQLLENGSAQEFEMPLVPPTSHGFVHFRCRADFRGRYLSAGAGLPGRRIVGFLDAIDV